MRFLLWFFLLASAVAPAATAAPAAPAIQSTATVNVLVTDRRGKPVPSAHVMVNGVSEREGKTNGAGRVVFRDMETGDYVLRVEHNKFITFEKDFAVRGQGGSIPVVAAVSPLSSLTVRPSRTSVSASRR